MKLYLQKSVKIYKISVICVLSCVFGTAFIMKLYLQKSVRIYKISVICVLPCAYGISFRNCDFLEKKFPQYFIFGFKHKFARIADLDNACHELFSQWSDVCVVAGFTVQVFKITALHFGKIALAQLFIVL